MSGEFGGVVWGTVGLGEWVSGLGGLAGWKKMLKMLKSLVGWFIWCRFGGCYGAST